MTAQIIDMPTLPDWRDFDDYERGAMSDARAVIFFQRLINGGHAWRLQGYYGRTADAMIECGLCQPVAPR